MTAHASWASPKGALTKGPAEARVKLHAVTRRSLSYALVES